MMSNVLTVVSKSLRGAITCVKLDADKYPGLASRYKIKALPTLVLFKVRLSELLSSCTARMCRVRPPLFSCRCCKSNLSLALKL